MKTTAASAAAGGLSAADAELAVYAMGLAKSADTGVRRRAEEMLERLGVDPHAAQPGSGAASAGASFRFGGRMLKSEAERRFTLMLAYPAWRPDQSVALDQHRDFAGYEANERACWEFTAKSRRVGLWHSSDPQVEGAGEIVESYVHRGPKWKLRAVDGSTQIVKRGDWMIGVRWTPPAWELLKRLLAEGKPVGISMQGMATRRQPSPDSLARVRERQVA